MGDIVNNGSQKNSKGYTFAIITTILFFVGMIAIIVSITMCKTTILALLVPLMILFWLISLGWANNGNLNKGEMRRALAGAIFSAFIVIIIIISTGDNKLIIENKDIINFFFGMVSTIIGFYFGYRSGKEKE